MRKFMNLCKNLFVLVTLCFAVLFLSGMEGCNTEDEEDEIEFVSATPASGSTIKKDATIRATFDGVPTGLSVAGGKVSVTGTQVTIVGPFKPGTLNLFLTWDDGAAVLTYTVPTDRYDGDSIIFEQGGTIYEGRVIEGISEDEVLVRLADGSEEVISVDRIAGTLIDDHPDLGTRVVLLSEQEGESILDGDIVAVYDNGVRKIKITLVSFVDDTFKILEVPRIRYEHEDTDFEDGGYLTLDEFVDWLVN